MRRCFVTPARSETGRTERDDAVTHEAMNGVAARNLSAERWEAFMLAPRRISFPPHWLREHGIHLMLVALAATCAAAACATRSTCGTRQEPVGIRKRAMQFTNRSLITALAAAVLWTYASASYAQSAPGAYPNRPIRFIL